MGRIVHLKEVQEFAKKTPVLSFRDVATIVGNKEYAALLLHNLERTGRLNRVTRGYYTISEDPVVSVFAFRPAYLGLQEALSMHDLWEQETNVVIVTAGKSRPGIRATMGSRVLIRRIDRDHFFGYDYVRYGQWFVPVSDVEKTLIDLAYFRERIDDELLDSFRGALDRARLVRYLGRYDGNFRKALLRRLGLRAT